MDQQVSLSERTAYFLGFGAAVSSLVSIALSHTLLALALAALLLSRQQLRLPPVWKPLALFMGLTILSLLNSESPLDGSPQVRKFYVFLFVLVVYSCFRHTAHAARLLVACAGAGVLSAAYGLVQFQRKYQRIHEAGQPFYESYVADRITGFMSHWMTYAGQMMIVLLVLAALLLFARRPVRRWPAWAAGTGMVAAVLVLGYTRSIWLATAAGVLYVVWFWRRWLVVALPAIALLAAWQAPSPVRERIDSIYRPHERLDSNEHRRVLRRTGWQIMLTHPLAGVGPQHVERNFQKYIPPDVPRPIPMEWWYGHLHNIYIHYAAERGIPALLALLWLFGQILFDFGRALRKLPPGPSHERFLLQASIAVTVGVMVAGWWELNLGDSEVLALFLIVVACGYAAVEPVRARGGWPAEQEEAHAGIARG
jgi:putative inorganic carbon (HCO3(-)) transporter